MVNLNEFTPPGDILDISALNEEWPLELFQLKCLILTTIYRGADHCLLIREPGGTRGVVVAGERIGGIDNITGARLEGFLQSLTGEGQDAGRETRMWVVRTNCGDALANIVRDESDSFHISVNGVTDKMRREVHRVLKRYVADGSGCDLVYQVKTTGSRIFVVALWFLLFALVVFTAILLVK